jgi:hypothetical protein
MSKMGSHCSFGHLKHKLWPKEGPRVELSGVRQFWLPTSKSRESTQNTWLQRTCDIPLKRSRWDLQLCFRRQLDWRSAPKVIRLQSRGSPKLRDFGTPVRESRESRERKAIWMQARPRAAEYTIRGKWLASPRGEGAGFPTKGEWGGGSLPSPGVVCESESEFTRGCPNTKRVPNEYKRE